MSTAFPAPTKLGKGLRHEKTKTKKTGQVMGRCRISNTSRNTAFPALTKLGKSKTQTD
jgi:acyl dehydratase